MLTAPHETGSGCTIETGSHNFVMTWISERTFNSGRLLQQLARRQPPSFATRCIAMVDEAHTSLQPLVFSCRCSRCSERGSYSRKLWRKEGEGDQAHNISMPFGMAAQFHKAECGSHLSPVVVTSPMMVTMVGTPPCASGPFHGLPNMLEEIPMDPHELLVTINQGSVNHWLPSRSHQSNIINQQLATMFTYQYSMISALSSSSLNISHQLTHPGTSR